MEKPILLVDFGRLMGDHLRNRLNINKKTFILDDYVVDAIPIEWIEEYRQNREDYADEYNAKAVLKRLIETWEEENANNKTE